MDVRINVVGQKLVVSSNYIKLIGGSNKFIRFVFALDSSWTDLMPYAQFTQNGTSYNVYLDSNNAVFLPPEIEDGTCTLTLGGSGNGVVATTDYVKFNITGSILSEGQESTDITESMYEQLVDRVVAVRDGQSDLRSLITTESEARAQADTEIRQLITSESSQRESDISSLTHSVEAANNYGTTLNQRIASEASTRATADASMQTQIDNFTTATNRTISDFKSDTNSSISDIRSSISSIRTAIGNDIGDVRDEIDDAVAVLNSRMDLALQQLNKHEIQTVLFEDNQDPLAYIGDKVTLSDDPTTFDYIDFYYKTHVNSSGQGNWDKVFRFEPNSNQPTIVSVQPSDSSATNRTLYVHEISFSLVGTEITVVRSRRWYWNGNANAAASLQQSDENSGTAPDNMYGGRVYKIVGINISDIDELTDLRIGTDGTIYQSAGTAIRTQLSGLQNKTASSVSYNVANSGLTSNNVQGAIDEVVEAYDELNERLTWYDDIAGTKKLTYTKGYYIAVNGDTADTSNPSASQNWSYAVDSCQAGDTYNVIGYGSSSGRLWAFLDASGNVLYRALNTDTTETFFTVQAPANAVTFVSNSRWSDIEGVCIKGKINLSGVAPTFDSAKTAIPQNTDLFTLGVGDYYTYAAADVETFENCPTSDKFRLIIYRRTNVRSTEINAILFDASRRVFINSSSNGNWLSWTELLTEAKLSAATVDMYLSASDYKPYRMDGSGNEVFSGGSLMTKGFISENVPGFAVVSNDYKVCLCIWNKSDGSFRRSFWYTSETPMANDKCTYLFRHETYKYKLYIFKSDESTITNPYEAVQSVRYQKYLTIMDDNKDGTDLDRSAYDSAIANRLKKVMKNNYSIDYANALQPISLRSVYGDNQNVHPKVLYFSNGFGGHKYWMAYTPYPYGATAYENPCIAYSDDGYEWTNIVNNPIDEPGNDDSGYMSDTHLVYRSDTNTLECWYRIADSTNMREIIYRKTSSDGMTWGVRETMHVSDDGSISTCLSPAVIWDGSKYQIWTVYWGTSSSYIEYWESANGTVWEKVRNISLTYTDAGTTLKPWHIDVIKDNDAYVVLAMCKYTHTQAPWTLFISTSADNTTFTTPYAVIRGDADAWDKKMYRSSLVKVDGEYRIYYSALDDNARHYIGISVSDSLNNFIGSVSG